MASNQELAIRRRVRARNASLIDLLASAQVTTLGSLFGIRPEERVESEGAVHMEPPRYELGHPDLQPVKPVAGRAVRRPEGLLSVSHCEQFSFKGDIYVFLNSTRYETQDGS